MTNCRGCGGVLGIDCYHEEDCMAITADIAQQRPDLQERVAELEAQLAALDWREITEKDLPKVGDEVLDAETVCVQLVVEDSGVDDWTELGYTHFRPLAPPPAPRSKA